MHQRPLVSSGTAVGRSVSSASIGFWCPGYQFEVPRSLEACQLGWMTAEFNYRERPLGGAVALRTSQVRTTLGSNSSRGMLVVGEPTPPGNWLGGIWWLRHCLALALSCFLRQYLLDVSSQLTSLLRLPPNSKPGTGFTLYSNLVRTPHATVWTSPLPSF